MAVNKDPSQFNSSTFIARQNHHQRALKKLIHTITSPPLLSYPDFHQPFILQVNASTKGPGCSLYEPTQGKLCVLGFGSRILSKAGKRYHTLELGSLQSVPRLSSISVFARRGVQSHAHTPAHG